MISLFFLNRATVSTSLPALLDPLPQRFFATINTSYSIKSCFNDHGLNVLRLGPAVRKIFFDIVKAYLENRPFKLSEPPTRKIVIFTWFG